MKRGEVQKEKYFFVHYKKLYDIFENNAETGSFIRHIRAKLSNKNILIKYIELCINRFC